MDLILIRETSRGQYLRHMLSLAHRGDPVRKIHIMFLMCSLFY